MNLNQTDVEWEKMSEVTIFGADLTSYFQTENPLLIRWNNGLSLELR